MARQNPVLKLKKLWLITGFLLIAFVVQQTLTPSPVDVAMNFSDKFLHVVGYFVLMGWFMQLYHKQYTKIYWAVFFVVMGVMLEFIQGWSGVRVYEVRDMFANTLGVVLAFAMSYTRFSSGLLMLERYMFNK